MCRAWRKHDGKHDGKHEHHGVSKIERRIGRTN
jgi:hypothetical protein